MIRALSEDDLDVYIALRQRALRECPLAFSASPESDFASSRDSLVPQLRRAPEWMLFGAFDARVLAGAVGLMRARARKAGHRMQLWGMYVAPKHRGHRLGEQLVDACIAHARSIGMEWIDLSVTSDGDGRRKCGDPSGRSVARHGIF